jgi:RHS repeat-associated protein
VRGAARYAYDPAHRLAEGFEYDAAGNLLRQPGLKEVRIRDGNRIAEANGERFEYNSRNHISARISEAGTTRYVYDSSDMLIAVESPKGRWEARYDALARRVSTTSGAHSKSYYWDGDRLAAEVSSDGRVRLYIYADDFSFTPFLLLDYADLEADPKSGKACYLYCNHLATPLAAEDDSGSVVWQARVEPYGAASIGRDAAVDVPLRFPGHYFDAETGLHYNRYRYYSPELGRYLQSDPVGIRGGANLYAYTNNPLKRVDLEGLNDCGDDGSSKPPPGKPPDKEDNDFEDEERTNPGISETPMEKALNGAILIFGDKGFRSTVKGDLDRIASYPAGKARLDSIQDNYENQPGKPQVTISEGQPGQNTCRHSDASNDGTPSSSTVILDPSSATEQTPSDVLAYHELTHADNAGQGNSQDDVPAATDQTAPNQEEENTVASENEYRSQRGVDNRENYADKP